MRLIDADEFIEYLGLDAEIAREDNLGEIVTLEDFDRQETACDLDKVVEKISEYADNVAELGGNFLPKVVIKIVKSGGVSND